MGRLHGQQDWHLGPGRVSDGQCDWGVEILLVVAAWGVQGGDMDNKAGTWNQGG